MILEGQSGLRNPSGPCGSEMIISGDVDGVILQHSPMRKKFKGMENYPAMVPDILDEKALIETLGGKLIGFSINTEHMTQTDIDNYRKELSTRTQLPIVFPFYDSLDPLIDAIVALNK